MVEEPLWFECGLFTKRSCKVRWQECSYNPLQTNGLLSYLIYPDASVPLQAEEEAARLASMPAWRRDMMKKKMDEER